MFLDFGTAGEQFPMAGCLRSLKSNATVKTAAILTVILASVFSTMADDDSIEDLTSHVFTNAVIVWQAPTKDLPHSFWIYQRTLPRIFSETVISNAIVLGSLQSKGFPKSSTNDFYIHENVPPNWPCTIPNYFAILPNDANLYYELPDYAADSGKAAKSIPADIAITAQAMKYARQLGLDTNKMTRKNFYTHFCNADESQNAQTNAVCGRGVFLSRQLDGVSFFSGDEQGDGGEGFFIEFGSYGKIRSFSITWSEIQRCKNVPTDDLQEIIHNIQSHKIIVLPNVDEENFFERLKNLARAKKVFVTKITPYYVKGVFGEVPTNDTPVKLIAPLAELEAVADFGTSNTVVRFVTPITR